MRQHILWLVTRLPVLLVACVMPPVVCTGETPARIDAAICRWPDGKKAALSLRFDDSHPTHATICVPMLNTQRLVGTFFICPGSDEYKKHREAWEKAIPAAGHELAVHTLHHHGARTDEEAESEIGQCADLIHRIAPKQGRLLQYLGGGGTNWMMRKPFAFFYAKYDLLGGAGAHQLGCTESYPWFSPEAFGKELREAIAHGDWLAPYFHDIGKRGLAITLPAFTAVVQQAAAHRDEVWCAGMSRIQRYQSERERALLSGHAEGDDTVVLRLVCTTDPAFYDQPLSLEMTLHGQNRSARVIRRGGGEIPCVCREDKGQWRAIFEVPPVDGVYEVRAKGIGAAWRGQHGVDIGPPPAHPYLFFSAADLPGLKAKQRRPISEAMWKSLKEQADAIVRREPRRPGSSSDSWEHARESAANVRALAFVYAVTADRTYLARAMPEIDVILAAGSWSDPRHKAVADLVSAEIAWSLALAYDWMYVALGEADRRRLREAIVHRGLEPIYEAVERNVWWANWPRGNWGAVILGKAGVAAMAVLADEPRAVDWIRISRDKMLQYAEALGSDGGWPEGISYAAYCWFNVVQFFEALPRVTTFRNDLIGKSSVGRLPYFYLHLRRPDGQGFVPFSNLWPAPRYMVAFLYRIAAARGDAQAQWIACQTSDSSISCLAFGFLWCNPDLHPKPPDDLPTTCWFRDIDWVTIRSAWNSLQATLLAFKGGQKDWDHFHDDTNSFVLYSHGQPLIVDLNYPRQRWGVRTEAHNTIMVNQRDQLGGAGVSGGRSDPRHRGVLGGMIETPWYVRWVGDASMTYAPADVKSFVREMICLRRTDSEQPSDYYLVFDDVRATGPKPVDWHLHTFGKMTVSGNRIEIAQEGAAATVAMLAPERFDAKVLVKSFDEMGIARPFPGATADTFVKLRPVPDAARGVFLAVIEPRNIHRQAMAVTAIRGQNLVGVRRTEGKVRDVALFALDEPVMAGDGITAEGRTCFVRRGPAGPVGAALHGGRQLVVDGQVLVQSQLAGDVAVTFGSRSIEVASRQYDSHWIDVFAPTPPVKAVVDGKELPIKYDAVRRTARIEAYCPQRIRLLLSP